MGETPQTSLAATGIETYLAALRDGRPSLVLAGARSPKGARTLAQILSAALRVFVRDGHAALSMRKVAQEAGVAPGNVNYYFASKRALVEAALREALADYAEAHIRQLQSGGDDALELLLDIVGFYVSNGRTTHALFFQIWGFAARDAEAKALIRELFRPMGRFIYFLVRAARPDAPDARIREIVLQLFSLEEGLKLFIGIGPDDDVALNTAEIHARTLARRIVIA